MGLSLKGMLRYVILAISALLALFVLSQAAQLVALASAVHAGFGVVVGVLLLIALLAMVLVPVLAFMRLDAPLVPPSEPVGPEHDAFVQRYLAACRRNPLLKGQPLMTEPDLVAALKILEKEAEAIANRTALQVFLGTAISQHGALDGVIVAAAQARMVWRIAHVYQRRPSLRHLGYLYSNVIATTMAAAQLDRIDLSEYVRPMVSAVVGQGVSSAPGFAAVSGQVSNAVFQGSVNAFLTLRLAVVAIAYSQATVRPKSREVTTYAAARAGAMVARTVATGTAQVTRAFMTATVMSVTGAATAVGGAVVTAGQTVGKAAVGTTKVVARGVSGVARSAASTAHGAAQTVWDGAMDAAEAVGSAATGAAKNVTTRLRVRRVTPEPVKTSE